MTEAHAEQQPEQHTDWLQDAQADLDPESSSTAWQDQLAVIGHAPLAEHADTSSALPDAAMPEAAEAQLASAHIEGADAEPQSSAAVADLQAIAPSAAAEAQASQHNEQTAVGSNAPGQHTDWLQETAPVEASGWADVGMEDVPAPTPALAASLPEAAQQHGQPAAALSENGHAPGEGSRILVRPL